MRLSNISIHALLAESDAAYVAKTGMTEISIHALLAESGRPAKPDRSAPDNFYPRSPCGERPCWRWDNPNTKPNFYPRSPCGERRNKHTIITGGKHFYPRSPCGERRCEPWPPHRTTQFLSTLSLRRATSAQAAFPPGECISIHALLAESDAAMAAMAFTAAYFYPRSPCGERLCPDDKQADFCQFLSTLSLRRATALFGTTTSAAQFLSTLSLRRATVDFSSNARATLISIHALLAESDMPISTSFPIALNFYPHSPCGERRWRCSCRRLYSNFYPRSPCGERRHSCRADAGDQPISIHALLAESDAQRQSAQRQPDGFLSTLSLRRATGAATNTRARHLNFYPRSPCGERRNNSNNELVCTVFLSTLSLRRATCNNCIFCFCHKISIHALLAESDVSLSIMMQLCEISIHALLAESDFEAGRAGMQAALFLSTLSLRRATSTSAKRWMPTEFLSTLSLRRATPSNVHYHKNL